MQLSSFAIFSILLYYCINKSTFVKIGNYLIHLEGALCRLKQPLNWKHISYVLFFVYLFNFSLFVSVFVTDIISLNSPVSSFGSILPAIFVIFCFIQYFSALSLTNAISININCAIQDFCRSKFGDITPNTLKFDMCLLAIQRFILLFEFETFTVIFVTLPAKFHDFILCPHSLRSLLYSTYYCTTFTTFLKQSRFGM